jgi:hypothetical protein
MAVHAALGKTSEWYTPKQYIEAARRTMGTIDLDPASSTLANKTVKARYYYKSNGLEQMWFGNVWLNPPYSNFRGEAAAWVKRMSIEYNNGYILQGIVLVNQSIQYQITEVLNSAMLCIVNHRIAYIDGNTMEPQKSPPQSNMFIYFGPHHRLFYDNFSTFGSVLKPYIPN